MTGCRRDGFVNIVRRVVRRLLRGVRPTPPLALGVRVPLIPNLHYNAVLCDDAQVGESVRHLGWQHPVRWKTWDLLRTAHFIKELVPSREARVLDAGCDGSPICEVLHAEGYRSLFGCDLTDAAVPPLPDFVFHRGDLTRTPWRDGYFSVVTCVSVIEHGVDGQAFLSEAARLLAPGGYLLISTDFNEPKIATDDVERSTTYGLPWRIFCRAEIEGLVERAEQLGLSLTEPIVWDQREQPVAYWGKEYTFIFFALRRT